MMSSVLNNSIVPSERVRNIDLFKLGAGLLSTECGILYMVYISQKQHVKILNLSSKGTFNAII